MDYIPHLVKITRISTALGRYQAAGGLILRVKKKKDREGGRPLY